VVISFVEEVILLVRGDALEVVKLVTLEGLGEGSLLDEAIEL